MTILDPTAVVALLIVVSLVAAVGVALVATLAAQQYLTRRPARPAVRRTAMGSIPTFAGSH